mmetsp:Transcript_13267/g.20641  ORF Transcript_13267/g.20641 Transcript_13267/m.20641 type:complete len:214 (+) Transcript_13267:51-692(+)
MSTTEAADAAATTAAAAAAVSSQIEEEEEKQNGGSSFLEAATSATEEEPDIENQQLQRPPLLPATDKSIGILAPRKSNRNKPNNNGEENQDDDDGSSTDSVFSFDSYEMKVTSRRIPLKFQSVINNPNNNTTGGASSSAVPFPSVNATTLDPSSSAAVAMTENVCPCRCLFFTLKESICLVMSALGCAVFLAGLVVLCLYLEGTLFEDEYLEK